MVGRPPSTARAAEMRRVLADLERSDLSVTAFCERRGISYSQLIYWRKRLATSNDTKSAAADHSGTFIPVRMHSAPESARFLVEFSDGTRIHVPIGFDSAELGRLLREVRAC